MRYAHLGIYGGRDEYPDPADRALPAGFLTDGDSFLVWGESPFINHGRPIDNTLHVIHAIPDSIVDRGEMSAYISRLRHDLYWSGVRDEREERLIDYAVITDAGDWSEGQRVWLLDGTIGKEA